MIFLKLWRSTSLVTYSCQKGFVATGQLLLPNNLVFGKIGRYIKKKILESKQGVPKKLPLELKLLHSSTKRSGSVLIVNWAGGHGDGSKSLRWYLHHWWPCWQFCNLFEHTNESFRKSFALVYTSTIWRNWKLVVFKWYNWTMRTSITLTSSVPTL